MHDETDPPNAMAYDRKNPLLLMEGARTLREQRRILHAVAAINSAESAGADRDMCAGDRWQCWMLLGEFERAWRESDSLRARQAPNPHGLWTGEEPAGKRVMVRCLHGLGDAIQFLRYAPLLQSVAVRVTVEGAPRLVPLLQLFEGIDEIITWGKDAPACPPEWDLQVEVMELPYIFRTHLASVPGDVPYLFAPPEAVRHVAQRMPDEPQRRAGLVWAGGEWNRERCIPLSLLEPLLHVPGVRWYSLQGGPDNESWRARSRAGDLPLRDGADFGDGLLALSGVIANLDLVITIDTMAAHLAGAMGKTVWLLLQHAADSRWMLDRSDSPWYPTMRIFRQPHAGDWAALIDEVRHALERWAAKQPATIDTHAALGQL